MNNPIRVTVWNEYRHEQTDKEISKLYPEGMHEQIAQYLRAQGGLEVRTATLDEPQHGLTDQVLAATDVLTWWGHMAHHEVRDEIVVGQGLPEEIPAPATGHESVSSTNPAHASERLAGSHGKIASSISTG